MTTTIPKFPILYKTKNNKIYQWSIDIEKINDDLYRLNYYHGQKDGKITPHTLDIPKGKQKRTVLEQAILEANKRWSDKKEKELYSEKMVDVSTNKDNTNLKSNSTSTKLSKATAKIDSIVVRPMLAKTFDIELYNSTKKAYKIPFPAYIQRKLDGIRCISYLKNDEVILESRTGSKFENFDVLKNNLKQIFELLGENVYLDGELYTKKIPFEDISGSVRKSKKHATEEDILNINKIEYHIYDILFLDTLDMGFKDRHKKIEYIFKKFKFPLIKYVETILIEKPEEVITYHDKFVNESYEGLIVRDQEGPYEINKRSKYLQKYKNFNEDEFEIIGFHHEDLDGNKLLIWDCKTKDGKEFAVVPNGTNEFRIELFKNAKKYIGKLLTVVFFGYTEKGSPRFPKGKDVRENY